MKKRIMVLAALVICLSIVATGSLAYFTATGTARNVITSGNIDIELKEMAELPDGTLAPFEDLEGVMPGEDVSKIVSVVNTGESAAYVRLEVTKAIELEGAGEADPALLALDLNTESWMEKDGYYYYNKPLAPGAETEPLFTTVTFSEKMDNIYQSCTVVLTVQAHATQVANNGTDPLAAAGWPAE